MSNSFQPNAAAKLRARLLSGCTGAAVCGALVVTASLPASASTPRDLVPASAAESADGIVVADLGETLSSIVDGVVQAFTGDDVDDDDLDDEDDLDDDLDDQDDEDEFDDTDDDDGDDDDGDDGDDDDGDDGGDDSDD